MKRRGFTLIELMVVIAIIIILAAIAIPNYLTMTARAKRSRVASDFAAIATALETYKTDWNTYPIAAVQAITLTTAGGFGSEITGGTGGYLAPTKNTGTTASGETAPITYMTANILKSMINPYSNAAGDQYKYTGAAGTTTSHWLLTATTVASGAGNVFLSRTDEQTTLSGPAAIVVIPSD